MGEEVGQGLRRGWVKGMGEAGGGVGEEAGQGRGRG